MPTVSRRSGAAANSFVGDTSGIPTAQCGTVVGSRRLRQSPRRASTTGGHPHTRDRRPHRRADGQPGRARRVGGRHRRRHGRRARRHRHHPTVRPGRLRPARSRALHARAAVPHRRRVRRLPPRTDGRLQPGGRRAHRSALPPVRAALRRSGWARDFLANVGTASTARDMDVVRAALGENQINYLGFSYGTELGAAYAEALPRPGAGHGARRRRRPELWTRSTRTSAKWPDSKRLSTTTPPTARSRRAARSAPTRRSSSTATTSWSTRWCTQPGRTSDPRGLSYQDAITGTVNALYTQSVLEVPDQRAARPAARHRPRRPAGAGRRLPEPRRGRPLPRIAGRVQRHPLRRRAVPDRPGGVGRRRPTGPRGRHRS